ncbi:MAG: phosphopentomutase [Ruminococcaceae bacterium]|nr:phosphopentomutase [Oscillospiraceae bacterium]
MKRVFLIILDSLGIGEAPDAKNFGDVGANTLGSAYKTGILNIPNLTRMGLGNIDGIDYLEKTDTPSAAVGRLIELSAGKDTTIGHWEIGGIVSQKPLPTYPCGFPDEIIRKFEEETGLRVLCNKPYSGTDVIRDYGKEHLETDSLIVYTSADSVFQIAAHEDKIPPEKLYEYCTVARKILVGEHAVGRVIARPFISDAQGFKRTANRRDFSIEAPKKTLLDALSENGLDVISVGKISDIFAGRGITESNISHGNTEGLKITSELLEKKFSGLAFINLVDFDSNYGHRQDAVGYAGAINEFDSWLPSFIEKLKEDDALIITADHGCDPSDDSTDHTREYTPLLVFGEGIKACNVGTKQGFGTVAKLVSDMLSVDFTPDACEEIFGEIAK